MMGNGFWLFKCYAKDQTGCVVCLVWDLACEQLIEEHPNGIEVALLGHFVSTRLLRGHVAWGAENLTGYCEFGAPTDVSEAQVHHHRSLRLQACSTVPNIPPDAYISYVEYLNHTSKN